MTEAKSTLDPATEIGQMAIIPVQNISVWELNPRKYFDEKALKELALSIEEVGILEPILVRRKDDTNLFTIIAGERRFKAAKLVGLNDVPCLIKNVSEKQALEIAIIENLQRTDVHPLDEAEGFLSLSKQDYDTKTLSVKFGIAESTVTQRLKLLDLIPKLKELFYTHAIKLGHAILLCRLRPELQKECLKFLNQEVSAKEFPTVSVLKEYISQEIMMQLDKVNFDITDEKLIKSCGACTSCLKRTGANKLLFDDLQEGDMCMDRICFDKKNVAHIEKGYKDAIANQMLIVAGYDWMVDMGKLKDDYPGVLIHNDWSNSSKKDGGVEAFCVFGPRQGEVIYVKKNKGGATGKQLKNNPDLLPVATQITDIKKRMARAKELDQEKIYTAAIEKAKLCTFPPTRSFDSNSVFGKIFILFLYDKGQWKTGDILAQCLLGKKKGSNITQADEDKFLMEIVKGAPKMDEEIFNIFIHDLIDRYGSVKSTNALQKFIMTHIFKEFKTIIGYDAIIAAQEEKAKVREKRANDRITALKDSKKVPVAMKKKKKKKIEG